VGPNPRGGEGGGGGEIVAESDVYMDAGTYPVKIGKGGTPGEDGGDTIAEGIRARGGLYGRSGSQLAAEEQLLVSAFQLADCTQVRQGLINVLGAGWERYDVRALPAKAVWPFFAVLEGPTNCAAKIELLITAMDPSGACVFSQRRQVQLGPARQITRIPVAGHIECELSVAGVWHVELSLRDRLLFRLPLWVKLLRGDDGGDRTAPSEDPPGERPAHED